MEIQAATGNVIFQHLDLVGNLQLDKMADSKILFKMQLNKNSSWLCYGILQ